MITRLIFAVLIFTTYVVVTRIKLGALPSISESYYVLPRDLKALFTLTLFSFSYLLITAAQDPIIMLSAAGICFTGAAPMFKQSRMEEKVHKTGAFSGIIVGYIYVIKSLILFALLDPWNGYHPVFNRILSFIANPHFIILFVSLFGAYLFYKKAKDHIRKIEILAFSGITSSIFINIL